MRILLLVPAFPDSQSPFGPAIIDTLVEINKAHELSVHSIGAPPQKGPSSYRGLSVYGHGSGDEPRMRRLASFLFVLAKSAGPIDLVWSLWPLKTGRLAWATARLLRKPLIASLMGGELANFSDLEYGEFGQAKSRRRLRDLFSRCDAITVGSQKLYDKARQFDFRIEPHICPIGVALEGLKPRPRRKSDASIAIMIVSDSSRIKRVELALSVAKHLLQEGKHVSVDWFGVDLQNRAPSILEAFTDSEYEVKYHAYLEAKTFRARYADFDLLLHTSAHESQGMALIEAALCELPIAVSDVGVASELVELGASITIAKDDSVSAFSKACTEALNQKSTESKVADRFGVDACARRFTSLFEQIATGA